MSYLSKVAKRGRYGAFELKAKYRRNMFVGTLISTFLALATTAGAFLFTNATSPRDTGPIIRDAFPRQDTVTVTIKRWKQKVEKPTRGSHGPIISTQHGWKPVPVAGLETVEDTAVKFTGLTGDMFFGGVQNDTGTSQAFGGNLYYSEGVDLDGYPSPDSFRVVDINVEMIYEHKPDYPNLAKSAGLEGIVWIKALVDIDGYVKDALVMKSSGSKAGFDEAALAAAFKNRYRPAVYQNKPIPVWVTYRVEFVLENDL